MPSFTIKTVTTKQLKNFPWQSRGLTLGYKGRPLVILCHTSFLLSQFYNPINVIIRIIQQYMELNEHCSNVVMIFSCLFWSKQITILGVRNLVTLCEVTDNFLWSDLLAKTIMAEYSMIFISLLISLKIQAMCSRFPSFIYFLIELKHNTFFINELNFLLQPSSPTFILLQQWCNWGNPRKLPDLVLTKANRKYSRSVPERQFLDGRDS